MTFLFAEDSEHYPRPGNGAGNPSPTTKSGLYEFDGSPSRGTRDEASPRKPGRGIHSPNSVIQFDLTEPLGPDEWVRRSGTRAAREKLVLTGSSQLTLLRRLANMRAQAVTCRLEANGLGGGAGSVRLARAQTSRTSKQNRTGDR